MGPTSFSQIPKKPLSKGISDFWPQNRAQKGKRTIRPYPVFIPAVCLLVCLSTYLWFSWFADRVRCKNSRKFVRHGRPVQQTSKVLCQRSPVKFIQLSINQPLWIRWQVMTYHKFHPDVIKIRRNLLMSYLWSNLSVLTFDDIMTCHDVVNVIHKGGALNMSCTQICTSQI